ncbi:putative RDD family membrane protein YckC [Silvimonas terrae]|uniref:Putative RDD family membrane protein YckC n=1 Tax=Silvimonas terrae TaxID=300266 RepID=A0A840RLW3_9NEIS|nr:RDD family protein [Silvimonas terrae]MBB5193266.1 putative RDD family membrane protein YckC [Silvimonas terrae]
MAGVTSRAGWWRRFFAWWYELLLLVPVLLLAGALFQGVFQLLTHLPVDQISRLPWARNLSFAWLMVVMFGYFAWCWKRGGQTLAMKTWRIRLVALNGELPGWRAVSIRFAVCLLCFAPVVPLWVVVRVDQSWLPWAQFSLAWCIIPFAWAWFDGDKQFLHDRLAGTRLVFAPKKPRQQPQEAPQS